MKKILFLLSCAATLLLPGEETPQFLFGTVTHFAQDKANPVINLELLTQTGMNTLRDEIPWRDVEEQKGKLVFPRYAMIYTTLAVRAGVTPLIICDYGNRFYDKGGYPTSQEAIDGYIRYCDFLMESTAGKVRYFQLWNEWDGTCGMGSHPRSTMEAYYKLLSQAYPVLKKKHPEVTIIANPICTGDQTFEKFLKLGGAKVCDVLAIHPYNFMQEDPRYSEEWYARMLKLQAMIRRYNDGRLKPFAVTEMGFPNGYSVTNGHDAGRHRLTLQQSADSLTQILLLAKTLPDFPGFWTYDLQDDGWNRYEQEHHFGLFRPDATPKPAQAALQSIAPLLTRGRFTGFLLPEEKNLRILRFEVDGKEAVALWCIQPGEEIQVALNAPAETKEKITVFPAGAPATQRSWGYRASDARRGVRVAPRQLRFSVSERPLILIGNFKGVKVEVTARRSAPANVPLVLESVKRVDPPNLDFRLPARNNALPNWRSSFRKAQISTPEENGRRLLRIVSPAPGETKYSEIIATVPRQNYSLKGKEVVIFFSGRYRLKEVTGRGVTFSFNFYDKNNKRKFKDYGYMTGSTDGWVPFRYSAIVPDGTTIVQVQLTFGPNTPGIFEVDSLQLRLEVYR